MSSRSFRSRPSRPPLPSLSPDQLSSSENSAENIEATPTPFVNLPLSPTMQKTMAEVGYTNATPIQIQTISHTLQGHDVLGQAPTGSGKTAAFCVPIIEQLDAKNKQVQALILCPTRELVMQVHEEFSRLAKAHNLISTPIYGGHSINKQLAALRKGPPVIIATPGRLLDHCRQETISLKHVKVLVLDEADRMLDMGFAQDVEKIIRQCPKRRQTLLFSATMPSWVQRLAEKHMHNPTTIAVSTQPEIAAGVEQFYVQTTWAEKLSALTKLLDDDKLTLTLIFVETKRTADILEVQLNRRGYQTGILHGDISQAERNQAISQFSKTHTKYLIATNIAARGLDIDNISHVINYDIPSSPDEYLHRVGRTARAGRTGIAITLITPSEILKLREVERYAQTKIKPFA